MDLGLKGRTALVLGAGGGLGSAISARLAAEGAKVIVADTDAGAAGATVDAVTRAGGKALAAIFDLADAKAGEAEIRRAETAIGQIDILVNNTGGPPPSPASGQSAELWRKQFESMVLSIFLLTDLVLPGMRAKKWGRIVTSTSSGVVAPIANLGVSNALRLSLVGWSKTLAREVAADGITANVILPGRIATQRIDFLDRAKAEREKRDLASVVAESTNTIPMGRYGRPEEYADAVAFLASERASYITGSVIRVDGGMLANI
jgi:3-oxoacyl-[acyl-carrier protein] reductase